MKSLTRGRGGLVAGEEAQQATDQGLGMTCQRALVDHAFTGHQGSVAGHRPTLLGQHQAVSGHQLTGVNPLLCRQAGTSVWPRRPSRLPQPPSLPRFSPPPGRHTHTRTDSLTMSLRVWLCCG